MERIVGKDLHDDSFPVVCIADYDVNALLRWGVVEDRRAKVSWTGLDRRRTRRYPFWRAIYENAIAISMRREYYRY